MKSIFLATFSFLALVTLGGCASITGGTNQVISVETRDKGLAVSGAACTLTNPKGTFFVTSPGTVTIQRAYDDLNVKCEKEGLQPGLVAAKSSTKGMAFGNIIFGGIIGAAIDVGSGAAYDYPSLVMVSMGENSLLAPQPAYPANNSGNDNASGPASTNGVGVKTKDWSKSKENGPRSGD
jgi:hypothetical protein